MNSKCTLIHRFVVKFLNTYVLVFQRIPRSHAPRPSGHGPSKESIRKFADCMKFQRIQVCNILRTFPDISTVSAVLVLYYSYTSTFPSTVAFYSHLKY